MVAQDRAVVDGGEEKTAVQHIPNSLAEARKIVSPRVKGVVFAYEKSGEDDCEEQGQDYEGCKRP